MLQPVISAEMLKDQGGKGRRKLNLEFLALLVQNQEKLSKEPDRGLRKTGTGTRILIHSFHYLCAAWFYLLRVVFFSVKSFVLPKSLGLFCDFVCERCSMPWMVLSALTVPAPGCPV